MSTRNDVTGDRIQSKKNSDAYKDGWDAIWGNKGRTPREIPEPHGSSIEYIPPRSEQEK